MHTSHYSRLEKPTIPLATQGKLPGSTYHYAYARQTQVNWKMETKKRKEDKGKEIKDKTRKRKNEKRMETKEKAREAGRDKQEEKEETSEKRKQGKEKRKKCHTSIR